MEECSHSWYSYGLAAVTGVLVLETFAFTLYCYFQNRKKRKYKSSEIEELTKYSSAETNGIQNLTPEISVISTTIEHAAVSENGPTESLKEHAQSNGLANGVATESEVDPDIITNENAYRDVATSPHFVQGKASSKRSRKKASSHQRIDPHRRNKKHADIIRINSLSTDEEKEETITRKEKEKSEKRGSGRESRIKKKGHVTRTESQKGIMKTQNNMNDSGVNGKNDSVSLRDKQNKKSVRFNLQKLNDNGNTKQVLSSPTNSNISIISTNKRDGIDNVFISKDAVDATDQIGKRKFILISDEEDEPAIVEIQPNTTKTREVADKAKCVTAFTTERATGIGTERKDGTNYSESSEQNSNSPSDKNNNPSVEDKNQCKDENKNAQYPQLNAEDESVHLQNKPTEIQIISHNTTGKNNQIVSDELTESSSADLLVPSQTVVLVEKERTMAPDTANISKTDEETALKEQNINNLKSLEKKENKNANVVIIPLEDTEDNVAQSKQSIVRGHVNSLIKMFQKIDGGKELSEEFNC